MEKFPSLDPASAGDLVRAREGLWRVADVRMCPRVHLARADEPPAVRIVRLIGADDRNRWQPCTLLEPFDVLVPVRASRQPRIVSRARWMRTLAALVAAAPSSLMSRSSVTSPSSSMSPSVSVCPASVADAQVALMPHQLEPLIALLRGDASRLLLADAVGLGKTIQAALLLRELRARSRADRVLILVPPGLRDQWRDELLQRVGLSSLVVDTASLAACTRALPPDINPWTRPGVFIASLDFAKQPDVLTGVDAAPWDVLIVDEAHGLNAGTDRLHAVSRLARHSRFVVLLSATPHHGSDDAFAALCDIGRLDDANDPIAIFRRTRATLKLPVTRRVHVLRVAPTPRERWLHELLARYIGRVEAERRSSVEPPAMRLMTAAARLDHLHHLDDLDHPASLAMSVLLKRAWSSASSLARSLNRRLALLDARDRAPRTSDVSTFTQTQLPFHDDESQTPANRHGHAPRHDPHERNEDDDPADREPIDALGAPGMRNARIERAWLRLLLAAARNAARDESKPRALARWLRRSREPALVYTEYRDTLDHLARVLSRDVSWAMLHGGLGANARRDALRRFAAGDARVLLTTDAAGEGLNLHHRCRVVVNVELPWNPNRLEQRIGRVDRLGQTRTVHALHLIAADTAEEQMLDRLLGRVRQIAATLGDAPDVLRTRRDQSERPDNATNTPTPREATGSPTEADKLLHEPAGRPRILHEDGEQRAAVQPTIWPDYAREARDAVAALAAVRGLRVSRTRRLVDTSHVVRADHVVGAGHVGHAAGDDGPRAVDPLLALDRRAPLVAIVRRRTRGPLQDVPAGLWCGWRTRVASEEGRAQPAILTAIEIACDVPSPASLSSLSTLASRDAVRSFVASMLESCRDRLEAVLDREVDRARTRLRDAERTCHERLARRDAAIARDLRTRRAGTVQPLLFEDIALARSHVTRFTSRADSALRTWPHSPAMTTGADQDIDRALVLVLVVR